MEKSFVKKMMKIVRRKGKRIVMMTAIMRKMMMMMKVIKMRKLKRMTMTKIMVKVKTFHLLHQQPAKVQLK